MNPTVCPRCGEPRMKDEQAQNALSRKDNETYVCPSCGTDEGMRDYEGKNVWPGFPDVVDREVDDDDE